MAKKEIFDTDKFFLITDDNTNLTEINSINNNHNVTLINDNIPDNTNETALTPSQSRMAKRRKIEYLAIMLHWVNENWSSSKILLDMVSLHNGSYIADKIFETITYYGSKILTIITDNARSKVIFGNTLNGILQSNYGNYDFEHVRCAAYVLNLAISDSMQVVVNSITKLRNSNNYYSLITTHFRRA
ncbi:17669_t:CDS:2 [Funneliformis caledonium]|uniref:17669_t:CDS:1 n=1 Tax=Funneliformis caledonium TaxID=1117310 RepID=A0A9N8WBV7_9GLOM|nr:17669_t:CDS:2 [Funneliformis caledonium]